MFIINKIQKWMDTIAGQTFMQYAYSWGAAIVILGTLFKLTHLPGANIMLFVGMGTEVLVFILSGFERVTEKSEESATEGIAQQPVYVSGAPVLMGGSPVVGGAAPVAPVVVGNAPSTPIDSEALAQGSTEQASAIEEITASIDDVAEKTKQNKH